LFTQKEIGTTFEAVLKEMNLKVASYNVLPNPDAGGNMGTTIDRAGNVKLEYDPTNPELQTLNMEGLRTQLSHEACHVATIHYSNVSNPIVDPKLDGDIWFAQIFPVIYYEYSAEKEFQKRFANDPRSGIWRSTKIRRLPWSGCVLNQLRAGNPNASPAHELESILYDAVYFPITKDSTFQNWCADNAVSQLSVLAQWLVEDFDHIDLLHRDWDLRMAKIEAIGCNCATINFSQLLTANRMIFNPPSSAKPSIPHFL